MVYESLLRIDAPPAIVWGVTEDIENWPQWTPTVTSVQRVDQGPFDVGSITRIKQPGLPVADWVVTELVHGERFAWETQLRGMRMKATHELRATATATESALRLEVSGLVAVLLWPLIRGAVGRTLALENASLKIKCEQQSGAGDATPIAT